MRAAWDAHCLRGRREGNERFDKPITVHPVSQDDDAAAKAAADAQKQAEADANKKQDSGSHADKTLKRSKLPIEE